MCVCAREREREREREEREREEREERGEDYRDEGGVRSLRGVKLNT